MRFGGDGDQFDALKTNLRRFAAIKANDNIEGVKRAPSGGEARSFVTGSTPKVVFAIIPRPSSGRSIEVGDDDQAFDLAVLVCAQEFSLHPDKTKIVYCRDESRRDMHPIFKFDLDVRLNAAPFNPFSFG